VCWFERAASVESCVILIQAPRTCFLEVWFFNKFRIIFLPATPYVGYRLIPLFDFIQHNDWGKSKHSAISNLMRLMTNRVISFANGGDYDSVLLLKVSPVISRAFGRNSEGAKYITNYLVSKVCSALSSWNSEIKVLEDSTWLLQKLVKTDERWLLVADILQDENLAN